MSESAQAGHAHGVSESSVLQSISELLAYQHIGQTGRLDDDAYYDPQRRLVLTTDLLVEGTHFRLATHSLADVGWKAAAVNISDIAAMGAQPNFLLISLGLPANTTLGQIEALYQGLSHCAKTYNMLIVGGDTVHAPQFTINVTAVGNIPPNHTPGFRAGARPGDKVIVSGPHGLSAAGLYALEKGIKNAPEELIEAHKRPIPRIEQGLLLSKRLSHYAMMDTSDGLGDACLKIAAQSGVQIIIEEAKLAMTPDLAHFAEKHHQDALHWVLYGGEDFELFATMPAGLPLPDGWREIGSVHAFPESPDAQPALLRRADGSMMPITADKTFHHF